MKVAHIVSIEKPRRGFPDGLMKFNETGPGRCRFSLGVPAGTRRALRGSRKLRMALANAKPAAPRARGIRFYDEASGAAGFQNRKLPP
jgi:hypothetical protein